jgi:hypothetical protein
MSRFPLSIEIPLRQKVVASLFLIPLVGGGLIFLVDIAENLPDVASDPANGGWIGTATTLLCVATTGLGAAFLPVYLLFAALRSAAWLDGTVLTVRGAFRTKSIDLAAARVIGEPHEETKRGFQLLVASIPGKKGRVSLRLGDFDRVLPRNELFALSDAITERPPHDRHRNCGCEVAGRLKSFAQQRFSVPRYLLCDPPPPPTDPT